MTSRSAMAVLAGASVLAPQAVLAEGLPTAPAPNPAQQSGGLTFTIDPGEDLSQRQGITVEEGSDGTTTATYYVFHIDVTVTTGSAGYIPNGTIQAADGQNANDLVAWVSANGSPSGEWGPGWACVGQTDMTSIAWTPSASTVQLRLFMKKDDLDARRAQINAPITFTIWLDPTDGCSAATSDDGK